MSHQQELRPVRWLDETPNQDNGHRYSPPLLYEYYSPAISRRVRRQRCSQTTISFLLTLPYVAIILCTLASLLLLIAAQNKYEPTRPGRNCVLGDNGTVCTLVYVMDSSVMLAVVILVVVTVVKAGCGMW